jgi:hypothetical protein
VIIGLLLRALSRRIIGSECNLWGVGLFWGEIGRSLICVSQVFDNVLLAEYHCRYDWQDRHVKDIREGLRHQTRFASPQGSLIPLTPQECLVVYRRKRPRRRAPHPAPAQQLLLFELVATG